MSNEKTFILLTFLIGMATAQSNNACTTPDKEEGVCVDIYDCPMLLYLLKDTDINVTAKTFLKESFCGYDNNKTLKVCCSMNSDTIPPQTNCGVAKVITDRIIGGNPAPLGAWPWIALLGYTERGNNGIQWNCGGTLISKRYVLTAAHCLHGLNFNRQKLSVVRLGELDLDPNVVDSASPIDVPVQKYIIHKAYDYNKVINDIGLVKLERPVNYTELIQPVRLSNIRDALDLEHMAFVAGWGYTSDTGANGSPTQSTALMEVEVPLVPTDQCKQIYSNTKTVIDHRVLCAGAQEGGVDSCRGDSGGPLMLLKNNQYILFGIVSYGHKQCGTAGFPGVYTNVAVHMQWVVEQIKNQ